MFQLSCFERGAAPVLPFISEISRFEMVLALMSDIYGFFRLITPFINPMRKSWLLVTKLGECVALGHHHIMSSKSILAGIYLFKVNNKNTRTKVWNMFKVNNKATKTRHWRRFGDFIVNFAYISHRCSSASIGNFEHVIDSWDVNKSSYHFGTTERNTGNDFENQYFIIFKPWKVSWNYRYTSADLKTSLNISIHIKIFLHS